MPSWFGNTPYTRDSLLPRSIVSMLTSFPLNAGVAELFAENTVRCVDANKISHD
ncbi:hypothetical protein HMPREF1602_03479 [Escherichia coli 907889]|nr:hypothetical protein HMPREF1602_03479 [Escherichia coli 907889]